METFFSLSHARDKTKKHLSPFLYRAQNLLSLLFLSTSSYIVSTRQILDDFYQRALQWCTTDDIPDDVVKKLTFENHIQMCSQTIPNQFNCTVFMMRLNHLFAKTI